jgi:hypothetical protein
VRLLRLIAVAGLALLPTSAALADGDPASDVLISASVYYPYSKPVSSQLQKALNAETAAARRAHFPIKVALIIGPLELGVIPELFDKPQQYAKFLDQELAFNGRPLPLLLVVMPAGYGVAGLSPAAAAAAASLPKPAGKTGDDLALAAVAAIPKLATAAGHPLGAGGAQGGGDRGSAWDDVAFGIVVAAAVLTAAAIIAFRRRQAGTR